MCCLQDISHSTDYDSFAKLWGHEPRFEPLECKDRESLLNDMCVVRSPSGYLVMWFACSLEHSLQWNTDMLLRCKQE
jgi:hypothetical protein